MKLQKKCFCAILSHMDIDKIQKKKHKWGFTPIAVILLGYFGLITFGTVLLAMPFAAKSNTSIGVISALFTATSAVCVTGLYVVDTFTTFNLFGQITVLVLIQIGGLGFMTMASLIFIAIGKRITLKERLVIQESLNRDEIQGVVRLTKKVSLVAIVIEVTGALLLIPVFLKMDGGVGLALWRSLFHSVSAFCNAGFDLLGGTGAVVFVTNPLFNLTIVTLIVLGGVGMGVLLDIFKHKNYKFWSLNTKVIIISNLTLILLGVAVFMALEYNNEATLGNLSFGEKLLAALFQSVSPRTAGYNTLNQWALTQPSQIFTILLMFIGTSPASTGGGIKVTTFVIVLVSIFASIRGKEDVTLGGRDVAKRSTLKAFAIIFAYISLAVVAVFILSITESGNGFTLTQLVFECVSALSTVGLTLGITENITAAGQIVLIVLMFLGRVGFLSLALIFTRNNNLKSNIKYPEAKIAIG